MSKLTHDFAMMGDVMTTSDVNLLVVAGPKATSASLMEGKKKWSRTPALRWEKLQKNVTQTQQII